MNNYKFFILYGGPTREAEVSIKTARYVVEHFPYELQGLLFLDDNLLIHKHVSNDIESSYDEMCQLSELRDCFNPEEKIYVFTASHGEFVEDGQIQQIFQDQSIKYNGCNAEVSNLCFDKYRTNERVSEIYPEIIPNQYGVSGYVSTGKDIVLKPKCAGSSVGVNLFNDAELNEYIAALDSQDDYLIQDQIKGIELTCGLIDGIGAVEVTEIEPHLEFYSFESKYDIGGSTHHLPIKSFDDSLKYKILAISEGIYSYLNCKDYARIDYIVDKDEEIYFLEINTLPGMTSTSLLPEQAKYIGLTDKEFLTKIIGNLE